VDLLLQVGLIEVAIGALLGWLMVVREQKPEWIKRIGIVRPHRILQIHLDFVLMGLILIAVGLVVADPPPALQAVLIFGTIFNPLLFVPLAFDPDFDKKLWYRAFSVVSFLAISGGLVWAAILGPA
jgi:hydroxylaminobenzene mutase